jgi:hypothetical protein
MKKGRLRKALCVSAAAVACFGAFAAQPHYANAVFALEITQLLNNALLGKQLTEQEIHTEKLFAIDEQTMLAVLSQPINTHGMTQAAVNVARAALGSEGMPYDAGTALGVHEETFAFDPAAVTSQETVMPVFGMFMDAQDQAARESVASIAAQQESSEEAREAVDEAVSLSQGSEGTTQALMAGNQINAATFGKLDSIQTGIQSSNYLQARVAAAEQADLRTAYIQRNFDTRDFITGPYQAAGSSGATAVPSGFIGY